MKELRIFGPPGTGKSTRLATEEIPAAVKKYGADRVVVTSFTRAGAKEIATKPSILTGQPIPVNEKHVGTLHALCYRLLGMPELVVKHIKKWNAEYPQYAIKERDVGNLDESSIDGENGNKLFYQMNIFRARMIDKRYWSPQIQRLDHAWSDFKDKNGLMDFTDLIEKALKNFPYAPGRPEVIFVDEAQDFTKLQLTLIRGWGQMARWVVLVGDDDQTIYGFAGASPDAFLNPPIENKYKRILGQSYRVPQKVLERASNIVNKISVREPKVYKPRMENGKAAQGVVRFYDGNFKEPDQVAHEAKCYIANGKTVMFLASCSYMLEPLKRKLREEGLPFWNPYRKTRGDWNPLQSGNKKTTARDVVVNFLSSGIDDNYWDIHQFVSWTQYLKVQEGGLDHKMGKAGLKALKKALKESHEGLHTARNVVDQILTPDANQPALDRNIDWLIENLPRSKQASLAYPVRVFKRFGEQALKESPKIIIGTIHSVKGGESDIVYLYPDISYRAAVELHEGDVIRKKDELHRLFYVGMTRAKEELVLMSCARQKGRYYFVEL